MPVSRLPWTWRTHEFTNGNPMIDKLFKRLYVDGTGNFTVKVYVDGVLKHTRDQSNVQFQWLPPGLYGKRMSLELASADGTGHIRMVGVEGEACDGT